MSERVSPLSPWPLHLAVLFTLTVIGPLVMDAVAEHPEPLPGYSDSDALREDSSLHAVAFINTTNQDSKGESKRKSKGIVVGDRGTIMLSEDGGESWKLAESHLQCRLDDVIWINERRVVAVGGAYDQITNISRGVVVVSNDGGKRWRRADDSELPRLRSLSIREADRALVAIGDWATSSLAQEFESHDGGLTWLVSGRLDDGDLDNRNSPRSAAVEQSLAEPSSDELRKWSAATKVNAPIRDACRVGESGLCAVGDHGVIVRSLDRGKSWQVVRGDHRHSSVLMIAATPQSVAWPLLGSEVLEMRNRFSLLLASAEKQSNDPTAASPLDLARQAATMLGAASVDQLADAPSQQADALQNWIAINRPSVVVLDQSLPQSLRATISQIAMTAGVRRVVAYSFDGRGESMLHRSAMLPNTGVLASDLWQDALLTVAPDEHIRTSIALRRLYDASGDNKRGESVTSGLRPVSTQRLAAKAQPASRRHLQIVQARLNETKRISDLINASRSASEFSESLDATINQTAKPDQFRLIWNVLRETQANPNCPIEFQVIALEKIADAFTHTSAGKWAALRSEAIQHSLEWARLRRSLPSQIASNMKSVTTAEIVPVSPFQSNSSRIAQASAATPLLVPKSNSVAVRQPNQKSPTQIDLAWEFHPIVLVQQDAARNRGDDQKLQAMGEGSANLRRLSEEPSAGAWAHLLNPRESVMAKATLSPPHLDGKLDDACWQTASTSPNYSDLQSASLRVAYNSLRVAYDEEFIYLATSCANDQLRVDDFVRSDATPNRDHDLSNVDRLEILIDTDSDLMTAMQFATTDGGRTHDAVDNHAQWNPTWYVASDRVQTPTGVSRINFEIAILRRDLADLPIAPGQTWFVSARPKSAGQKPIDVMPRADHWLQVLFH